MSHIKDILKLTGKKILKAENFEIATEEDD